MSYSPSRVWLAPPEWPQPPAGFVPPPGWQPDSTWPTPSQSHKFWRRTRAGKRRIALGIVLFVLVPALLLTACGAFVSVFGPLDLPPGDTETLKVVNDTGSAVLAFDCDDDSCVRGIGDGVIVHGDYVEINEDAYTPSPIGLADPKTHRLLGCLIDLPHADRSGNYPANETVKMSSAVACPGVTYPAPKVHFYNP